MPPRVGYWGTYTIYIQYSILCIIYTVEKKENTLIIFNAREIHFEQKFYYFVTMTFYKIFAPPFIQSQVRHTESCQNTEKLKEMPNPPQKKDFKKKRK